MSKITRSFSIDNKIYTKFENLCDEKFLDKNQAIKKLFVRFISDNYIIDKNSNYILKSVDITETVKIVDKIDEFIILDNGNKINIMDFELLYKNTDDIVLDVLDVLTFLGADTGSHDVEVVNPDILNICSINEKITEKIYKIDPSTILEDKDMINEQTIITDNRPEKIINDTAQINDNVIKTDTTIEDVKTLEFNENIEELSSSIVKRIKEKSSQLYCDIDNLSENLSYIFSTNVKVQTVNDIIVVNIPINYHNNIELNCILQSYGKYRYEI